MKSLLECSEERLSFLVALGIAHQHPNPPHGLLRAQGMRPRRRPASKNRDKVAAAEDEMAGAHIPLRIHNLPPRP